MISGSEGGIILSGIVKDYGAIGDVGEGSVYLVGSGSRSDMYCGTIKSEVFCEFAGAGNVGDHDRRSIPHFCDNWSCPVCGPGHTASKRGARISERFKLVVDTFRSELGTIEAGEGGYSDWAVRYGFDSRYVNSRNLGVYHGILSFPSRCTDFGYSDYMDMARDFFKDNGFGMGGLLVFHLWRLSGYAKSEFGRALGSGRWTKGEGGIWDFVRSPKFNGVLTDHLVFGPHIHFVGFGYVGGEANWGRQIGGPVRGHFDKHFYDGFIWKKKTNLYGERSIAGCVAYCLNHASVPVPSETFDPVTLEVKRSRPASHRWFGAMHNRVTCLFSQVTEIEEDVCKCGGSMLEHLSEDLSLLVDPDGVVDWVRVNNCREMGRYRYHSVPIVTRSYDMRVSLIKGGFTPHKDILTVRVLHPDYADIGAVHVMPN